MKSKKKKDRDYMAILDRPIEELKKPMGKPVFFDIQPALHFNVKEYRVRLKREKEERKRLREARKKWLVFDCVD